MKDSTKLKSIKGFQTATGAVSLTILLLLLFAIGQFTTNSVISWLITALALMIFILTVSGCVDSYRGIRDPNSVKKIVGLIVNTMYALLFVSMLIANIWDIGKAVK